MKIGCLDKSAAARLELQRFVDETFRSARESIGHLRLLEIVPVTVDELLVNNSYDGVVLGPNLDNEERYSLCKRLQGGAPLFLLFDRPSYTLRTLKRFEKLSQNHFCLDEPPIRLVHELCSCHLNTRSSGKLLTVSNVKGGAGCTTLTAALAHAAHGVGRTSVLLDLSPLSVLAHYLFAPKFTSPDYATIVLNHLEPERSLIERCLVTAPNGIPLLLPPSGGSETREQWLRDPDRLELSLGAVDMLREMFDVVIVDCGSVEGVLPYALSSIAEKHLIVSTNEAPSLHLLERKLTRECEGGANAQVIINMIARLGINSAQIEELFFDTPALHSTPYTLLPLDARGGEWIGSGNSFYTEASAHTQRLLDGIFLTAVGEEAKRVEPKQAFGAFVSTARTVFRRREATINLPPPPRLRLSPPTDLSTREGVTTPLFSNPLPVE